MPMSDLAGARCHGLPRPDTPDLVFLHGFMGGPTDWDAVAAPLEERFASIALALPGHVEGGAVDAADFEAAAAQVLARLEACLAGRPGPPEKRPVLVGYSLGGRVALYLALRHPGRFSAVVIESASPGISDAHARAARGDHDVALAGQLGACVTKEALRAFLDDWYARPPFDSLSPTQREVLAKRRLDNDPGRLAQALRAFSIGAQPDLWEDLPGLQLPTLVICGENDHKYRQIAEDMAAKSPWIAVQVMADCGHNVHFEQPAAYTTVLRGFLEGVA